LSNYSQINVSNNTVAIHLLGIIYKFILGFLETPNYQVIHLRDGVGGIWENFCIVERMKKNNEKKGDAVHIFGGTMKSLT
jgi:hypothetical protein